MIKVVAIKTLYTKAPGNKSILFKEGDILFITKKENSDIRLEGKYTYSFYFENGTFSSSYNNHFDYYEWSIDEIKDYYIPLAEWRDQQINSILDD